LTALFTGRDAFAPPRVMKALEDVGEARLKDMDESGIDIQVLSHSAPSLQKITSGAVELGRRVNDRLAAIVATAPKRFAGFAALPTSDPAAAADELERCVTRLGFKGAMIHGLAHGHFIDDARYWPIFARAEALDVPIYLHPAMPHEAVIDAYYKEYAEDYPVLLRAAWGFTVETATLAVRLVLSGVFEKHSRLKFILGHLGEGLPFYLWRIDNRNNWMKAPHKYAAKKPVADYVRANFHVTTSGHFSTPALVDTIAEIGADRVMYSVDYPFEDFGDAAQWFDKAEISEADRRKIGRTNALKLFKLKP
jgi:predicted TIM-barrel fold metal-dependent hydrolase